MGRPTSSLTSSTSIRAAQIGNPTASNLSLPQGVAVDPIGNLFVADTGNHRVLQFNTPFAGCNNQSCVVGNANIVYGQADFTHNSVNRTASSTPGQNTLAVPTGVAVDASENLYVADHNNNRVVEYNDVTASSAQGRNADEVFGQPDFVTNSCPNASSPGNAKICNPQAVAADSNGNVYITDTVDGRVVEYDSGHTAQADHILGPANFNSYVCVFASPDQSNVCTPYGLATDPSNNLYVVDSGFSRVLEFSTPRGNDGTGSSVNATVVFGQPDFFSGQANQL